MGQQGFNFPLSQDFQSQKSALLHKARCFEEALEAGKPNLAHNQEMDSFEPSDFLCLNDESDASSGENQKIGGRPSSSTSSPNVNLLESDQSSVSPPQVSQAIPSYTMILFLCMIGNVDAKAQTVESRNSSPNTVMYCGKLIITIINNQKNKKSKAERSIRYAFKTRSQLDILEDGYKWRKYGKKYVKNSPNPRNYYRCSYCNCNVKKRIERDAHDKGIVITTYEGKHNHESPTVVYYIGKPSIVIPQQASSLEHFPSLLSYTPHTPTDFMFINTT